MKLGRISACLAFGLLACGDSVSPSGDLEGTWDLIGYSDAGTAAVTTGTATFRGDGTFTVSGTLTFPDEPTEPVFLSGEWALQGGVLVLTVNGQQSLWNVSLNGDEATLTLQGTTPPTTITIRRSD
ncbi:MAG TPA: lipocalin family protein [Gemmatimonadales bacterium]|jgi:hypothetical protein